MLPNMGTLSVIQPFLETTNNSSVNAESLGLMVSIVSCLLDSGREEFFITSC